MRSFFLYIFLYSQNILIFNYHAKYLITGYKYKELGPRIVKLALLLIKFMLYGLVQFLLYEYQKESPNCFIYQTLLLMLNLDEQQAYTVVQLSDFAENWYFCTPIIVNIITPPTLDPKTFDTQKIILKCSKRLWLQKLDWSLGPM